MRDAWIGEVQRLWNCSGLWRWRVDFASLVAGRTAGVDGMLVCVGL